MTILGCFMQNIYLKNVRGLLNFLGKVQLNYIYLYSDILIKTALRSESGAVCYCNVSTSGEDMRAMLSLKLASCQVVDYDSYLDGNLDVLIV